MAAFFAAGVEVYAPLWAGPVAELGVKAELKPAWVIEVGLRPGLGVPDAFPGLNIGAGAALSRHW